jgi:hypothetical protein
MAQNALAASEGRSNISFNATAHTEPLINVVWGGALIRALDRLKAMCCERGGSSPSL